jgi:hypothetical protein
VLNDDELMRLAGWKSRQMLGQAVSNIAHLLVRAARIIT